MAEVAALLDRAVRLPPGEELAAVLERLAAVAVPNARLVELSQAEERQAAHVQERRFARLVAISHAVALAEVDGEPDVAVVSAAEQFDWAAHEVAAAHTWTPTAADRELHLATAVVERLPLVRHALSEGRIDRGKARVFVDHLDPATGDVTEDQSRRLCERFVPQAPALTTKQLSDRLLRALHAIDPDLRRRRYERAIQNRGVALRLDPRTGAAELVGSGLPAAEAAAAGAWLDRIVEAAKRAGHPGTRPQISADLYVRMLNASLHGLSEVEIVERLLAMRRPEDGHPSTTAALSTATPETGDSDTAGSGQAATPRRATSEPTSPDSGASGAGSGASGGPAATREGIEIRVGLVTAAGLDERPGEIPGLGPVPASVARTAVAAQHRGAAWRFAVVDTHGYLLLAGPLRRRPRTGTRQPAVRGGVVELHLTVQELRHSATDPDVAEWAGVLAEITAAWADRRRYRQRLAVDPAARFARGALAEHVRIRDRHCVAPGCTRPARSSDLDHTREHGRGGKTVEANIGPLCPRHHPDKDRGWSLTQPEPGLFVWISPLGRRYSTRGEPIRPDLPDPDPDLAPEEREDSAEQVDRRLRRHEPPILQPPVTGAPRPPPSQRPGEEGPPPF
jgi:hypothetical protein